MPRAAHLLRGDGERFVCPAALPSVVVGRLVVAKLALLAPDAAPRVQLATRTPDLLHVGHGAGRRQSGRPEAPRALAPLPDPRLQSREIIFVCETILDQPTLESITVHTLPGGKVGE